MGFARFEKKESQRGTQVFLKTDPSTCKYVFCSALGGTPAVASPPRFFGGEGKSTWPSFCTCQCGLSAPQCTVMVSNGEAWRT